MSFEVRAVRLERVASFWRSVEVTSMHLLNGIEGNRASASNDTKISSGSSFLSFIFFINSNEFLQLNGESLINGRSNGTRNAEIPSCGQPRWETTFLTGKFLDGL